MTTSTRTPAQAAGAGARGGAPASPHPSKSSSQPGVAVERETSGGTKPRSRTKAGTGSTTAALAARKAQVGIFKPLVHCGAHVRQCPTCSTPKKPVHWKGCPHAHDTAACRDGAHLCKLGKGWGTDHVGSGHCKLAGHGGSSPNGKRHAAKEAATKALERLGQPAGSGSPLQLLEQAVRYAQGNLEASAALLVEIAKADGPKEPDRLVIDAAREIFTAAIRLAGRVGKEAADAHIAERRATIDEMIVSLLERVLLAGLDELGLSDDQRETALSRMHRELVAVLPEPSELS
ncbi:MAG TPA: hypothetical protein VEW95_09500 [Candidatus Limnocylindrales bacterium]|nr:hypothetical protein [Candidatus Limnocylindrales bacterium]